jgi:plastocyanin
MPRRLFLVLALVLVLAPIASAATITLSADKSALKFNKKTLTAKAGSVTLKMTNPSPLQHNIAIKGKGINKKGKIVGKGGTSTVTATLKPGTYTFYCSVPGHEAGGMKGTLKVT